MTPFWQDYNHQLSPGKLKYASAAVLAGGASRRMGIRKELIPINGSPLVRVVLDQLSYVFPEVFVISDSIEALSFLGVPIIRDLEPGRGPLMAIITALQESRHNTVFIAACDMPDINFELISRLFARPENLDCVVPRTKDREGKGFLYEPLFALYRRSALSVMKQVLADGENRVHRVFNKLNTGYVDMNESDRIMNLNTPQDLKEYISLPGRQGHA